MAVGLGDRLADGLAVAVRVSETVGETGATVSVETAICVGVGVGDVRIGAAVGSQKLPAATKG